MKKINVTPLIGFSNVAFGMPRDIVRKNLGEFRVFMKSAMTSEFTDDFGFCHVFYNTQEEFEAVEFFSETEITIGENVIMPGKIDAAMVLFDDLHEEEGSFISKAKSIGITIGNDGWIESILFGADKYYQ